MIKKTCFIGDECDLPKHLVHFLYKAIKKEIDLGCKLFYMPNNTNFEFLALASCQILKSKYKIEIFKVVTSCNEIEKKYYTFKEVLYKTNENLNYLMFNTKETNFELKIIESNKKMIDECSTLICYVNPNIKSSVKYLINYAKNKGLKIINLQL